MLPSFRITFPTTALLVAGLICGYSLYMENEKGLAAAQTIAAIAGTAFQTHVNALKGNDEEDLTPENPYD